ncbi:MAG: hypothetical protein SCARUB_03130 [Candidatus Scalindua rubra]|uniref:Uncharacterized protein n=1 Tax=Candidatus Scalindua rubra TaxID=1872076 RepID=A0A1E3X7X5_9BACT|nr:MAG: hypothetical protein SCARUB_03130 [Candidatus Scalindua rubra]
MKRRDPKLPKMANYGRKAFKKAVARVIEDHHRTGDPIAVWRDGKVVLVPVGIIGSATVILLLTFVLFLG